MLARGKKDLGVTEFPTPDSPVVTGDLAFNYHTGGHTLTMTEWNLFLDLLRGCTSAFVISVTCITETLQQNYDNFMTSLSCHS